MSENCCRDQKKRETQHGNRLKGSSARMRERALRVCFSWREPRMRFPMGSAIPWSQLTNHHVWASVSSAKGEDWSKWTQVGLSGSKEHCHSGHKNPCLHFSSPAVPWRGFRGQSPYHSHLWRDGHPLLCPGQCLPCLSAASLHHAPCSLASPPALSGAHSPRSLPPSHWHTQNRRRRQIKSLGLLACGMDPLVSPQTNATLV